MAAELEARWRGPEAQDQLWVSHKMNFRCLPLFFFPRVDDQTSTKIWLIDQSLNFVYLGTREGAEVHGMYHVKKRSKLGHTLDSHTLVHAGIMTGQRSHFLIQFLIFPSHVQHKKKRGLPNTELHICTIRFNNIRDNRPFCCRRWWFPVNCVRTILNQNVKTLKFYTKVHLRVNECKTFTWQNGFGGFLYDATMASSFEQIAMGTLQSNERSELGTRQEGRGTDFSSPRPRDWPEKNCVQSSWHRIRVD